MNKESLFQKTLIEEMTLKDLRISFREHIDSGSSAVSFRGKLGATEATFKRLLGRFPSFSTEYYLEMVKNRGANAYGTLVQRSYKNSELVALENLLSSEPVLYARRVITDPQFGRMNPAMSTAVQRIIDDLATLNVQLVQILEPWMQKRANAHDELFLLEELENHRNAGLSAQSFRGRLKVSSQVFRAILIVHPQLRQKYDEYAYECAAGRGRSCAKIHNKDPGAPRTIQ